MGVDKERVKYLLVDAVTQLCKRCLPYDTELSVEGLLGIKIDKNDTFFLHISENLNNSDAPTATAKSEVENSQPQVFTVGRIEDLRVDSRNKNNTAGSLISPVVPSQPIVSCNTKRLHQIAAPIDRGGSVWPNMPSGGQLGLPATQAVPYGDGGSMAGLPPSSAVISSGGSQPTCGGASVPTSHSTANTQQPMDQLLMAVVSVPGLQASYQPGQQEALSSSTTAAPRHGLFPIHSNAVTTLAPPTTLWTKSTKDHNESHTTTAPSTSAAAATSDKAFFCPICGKGFSQQGNMQRHLRVHTGEKPYSCAHCRAQFAQSTHLKRHVRTHTEQRPYKCRQCTATFPRKNTLSTHVTTFHQGVRKSRKGSQRSSQLIPAASLQMVDLTTVAKTGVGTANVAPILA